MLTLDEARALMGSDAPETDAEMEVLLALVTAQAELVLDSPHSEEEAS